MELDGLDPLTASNAVLAAYANRYMEYDDNPISDTYRAITSDFTQNCSSCGGGGGTGNTGETYSRSKNPNNSANGYNVWKWKTTRTMADGLQNIQYANWLGQPMLTVLRHQSEPDRQWPMFYKFDNRGRQILAAMPSAITGYDETKNDLLNFDAGTGRYQYLRDHDGLIQITNYYTSTTATPTTPGGVAGYVQFTKIKKGQLGTEIKLTEATYIKRTGTGSGNRTVYPVADQYIYPDENDPTRRIKTSHAYTWYTNKTQVQQRTTTLPVVPVDQHGDGTSATRKDYHDQYGNLTWQMDERGFITNLTYSLISSRVVQRIEDVDTTVTSGAPSGWVTPSGGGLNLISNYEFDLLGRQTQTLGPSHQADLNGVATTVRRATWTVYKESCDLDETWTAQGYATGSAPSYTYTLVNPVQISKLDKAGRVIDSIASARTTPGGGTGKLQPTDTFDQSDWSRWTHNFYSLAGQLEYTRTYHTIPASGSGSPGTNYDESFVGYDPQSRLQVRTKTPGGTINRNVYDPIRRLECVWVGTHDTPIGGISWEDWSPTNNAGTDMVEINRNEYDHGTAGGDSNLTKVTQHVDDQTAHDRVTAFTYDFRNRRVTTDGEIDFFAKSAYDNLDRITTSERYDTTETGNLIARSETSFDDRNRVFETKTYAVNPETGIVGNALIGGNWYDPASNVIKSMAPGSGEVYTKSEYDSLGRVNRSFSAYDDGSGNDVIIEETQATFDGVSNVLYVTSLQRDTGTPAGSPTFRATYVASWHDGIDRPIATANYGTNGGAAFTRPDVTPARSDDVLVNSTEYDADTGEAFKTTDPKALVTKREFDDAGRTVKVIENFVSGGTGPDENRTTQFTYNADGNQATIIAVNADTGNQVTTYVYGTTLNDSEVASNLLLRAIQYPTDTSTSRLEMKYNRQGQTTERKDQAGTTHAYHYDKLGRQTQDRVVAFGPGVDQAVQGIGTTYEVRGMVECITSFGSPDPALDSCCGACGDGCAQGVVLNQVKFTYNDFGQLIVDQQSHEGCVECETPQVQYAYDPGNNEANRIRPISLTYPNGRVIAYSYGSSGGMDDKLNRVAAIVDVDGNLTQLAAYNYLGMGSVVVVDYTQPQVKLDLWGGTPGSYTGLDRFGRIIDHRWINYATSTDVARIQHGYDRNSNRLWRQNDVARALSKKFDQQYVYDGLNRLTDFKQGLLNGSHVIPNADRVFEQQWTLDKLGNWSQFNQDDSGDGTFDLQQTRTQNQVNEITAIGAAAGPVWPTPQYDAAGNTTRFPKPVDPTDSFTAVYDAWNRMVKVLEPAAGGSSSNSSSDSSSSSGSDALQVVQENAYDGRNYRIVKETYANGILDETRHVYYTVSWQVIEERLGTLPDTANIERQQVWGVRYIDDLILRDRDTTTPLDGTLNERLYALQDSNWNVTTITNAIGGIQDRYEYEAYGTPIYVNANWDDQAISSVKWEILFTGYQFDGSCQLYFIRHRVLHSGIGKWSARDILGYVDGYSLYEYAQCSPVNNIDAYGLQLKVTTVAINQPRCGQWQVTFRFDQPAQVNGQPLCPGAGWYVQHVRVWIKHGKCGTPLANQWTQTHEYYEAWGPLPTPKGYKGAVSGGPFNRIGPVDDVESQLGSFLKPAAVPELKGELISIGVIWFICESVMQAGTEPGFAWLRGTAGRGAMKRAGAILASNAKPPWWGGGIPAFGPAVRMLHAQWCCCENDPTCPGGQGTTIKTTPGIVKKPN